MGLFGGRFIVGVLVGLLVDDWYLLVIKSSKKMGVNRCWISCFFMSWVVF